jgi:protein-disulfide isomerase
MNRLIVLIAAVVVLAGGGVWYFTQGGGAVAQTVASETVADPGDTAGEFGVIDMAIGAEDAPVEIIEYASFTCPHCATFHLNVLPQLKKDYVDSGKVRVIHREVFFDKYGMWASLIARCAAPEKYFGIIDLVYKGQSEWARAGSEGAIATELRKIGRLAGIGGEQLDACLSDSAKLQNLVSWYQANAEAHQIQATPSFVINGKKYSNMSYADFKSVIDGKLGE